MDINSPAPVLANIFIHGMNCSKRMPRESNMEGQNKILDACRQYVNNPKLNIGVLADECKNKVQDKEYCKKLISSYHKMSKGEVFRNDISDAFCLLFLKDFEKMGVESLAKALASTEMYLRYRAGHGVKHDSLRKKCKEIADRHGMPFGLQKTTYIFTANEEEVFDVGSAFKENKCIDWRVFSSTTYVVGDIVYIYVASKGVKYRCIVSMVDIPKEELINDSKFWKKEAGGPQMLLSEYVWIRV